MDGKKSIVQETIEASRGRIPFILSSLGIDANILDRKHHACPVCRKSKLRISDPDTGAGGCDGDCKPKGWKSVIGLVAHYLKIDAHTATSKVADAIGIDDSRRGMRETQKRNPLETAEKQPHSPADPKQPSAPSTDSAPSPPTEEKELIRFDQNDPRVVKHVERWFPEFCANIPPVQTAVRYLVGIEFAYRVYPNGSKAEKFVTPIYRFENGDFQIVNWACCSIDGKKDQDGTRSKVLSGRGRNGLFLSKRSVQLLAKGETAKETIVVRVEGFSDFLTLVSIAEQQHANFLVFSNSFGASDAKDAAWFRPLLEKLEPKEIWIIGDNDPRGIEGARKWAHRLEGIAPLKKIELPEKVNDNRDFFNSGRSFEDFKKLAENPALDQLQKSLFKLDHDSGRTDLANALRFIDRYQQDLMFVPDWGRWLSWDGKRWADDKNTGVYQRAKTYANGLWFNLAELAPTLADGDHHTITQFIRSSSQQSKIAAFVKLAESDERVVCSIDTLNQDPFVLNVQNGTIDLRDCSIKPHEPNDRLTQICTVEFNATATCPKWLETMDLVFQRDQELIAYVQMILGYSISGDIGEAILPICYGDGSNGKSTVWNTVVTILGDYAWAANESLLLGDKEGHPTDKAALYQKRFVPISEPERGSKLRESRVKELTGDSMITARRMREDFWSFRRTHTFWLSTNHLPRVSGQDTGIWRRLKLIPMTADLRNIANPVKDYSTWLATNEGPGILNWLLDGWKRYQREKTFTEPKAVLDATEKYKSKSDALGQWIEEHCTLDPDGIATATELFERYAKTGGKMTQTSFGNAMAARFTKERPMLGEYRKKTIYRGLRLEPLTESTLENELESGAEPTTKPELESYSF